MQINKGVQNQIDRLIHQIKERQSNDGTWKYCFESGPMTDAFFIMMLCTLDTDEEQLIQSLSQRLKQMQHSNGSWRLFDDDEGNLSATVEAYSALLISGHATAADENMKKAEDFILKRGGVGKVHPSTKFMLALNGLYPWPGIFPLPIFLLNIPSFLPFSFQKLSSYVRVHLAPILILGHKKFSMHMDGAPDLSHLYIESTSRKARAKLLSVLQRVLPGNLLSGSSLRKAEKYILRNIETDGTLYSYGTATFYMVYALLALGYDKKSPFIQHAIHGLKSMLYEKNDISHLQNSPSTIWDTALLSYALQESGVSHKDPSVKSSVVFLQSCQQNRFTDNPGGWGFSQSNTLHPDIDDTQAALRAITRHAMEDDQVRKTWNTGVNWLMAMQNSDGGWGAFERNRYKSLYRSLPIENFKDVAIDPSTADLTGRTLEFLGNFVKMTIRHPKIQAGAAWLINHQEEDGSWMGKWGVSYIYGTWAAITGLCAVGVKNDHPSIRKAVEWLKNVQQMDGGWGESCKSDKERTYIALPYSTIVQTSWAVDALMAACDTPTPEIEKGIRFLTSSQSERSLSYPTGAGLPGHFYIQYHSYNSIWPLIALSHFKKKFPDAGGRLFIEKGHLL
jgi:sporulenol synthase